jgi:hypothetical protein
MNKYLLASAIQGALVGIYLPAVGVGVAERPGALIVGVLLCALPFGVAMGILETRRG